MFKEGQMKVAIALWIAVASPFGERHNAVSAFVPSVQNHLGKPFSSTRPSPRISYWSALGMSETEQVSIETVSQKLLVVKEEFDVKMAAATTLVEAEAIRRDYMGKKGPINEVMSYMRLLSNEDKPKLGAVVNEVKESLEQVVAERLLTLETFEIEAKMEDEMIDVTLPGVSRMADIGRRHPLSMTMEKAVEIFTRLGYDTVTGAEDSPEIETDYNCFEALNCPKDHPARDMQDTFYLTSDMELMLRTHTSSVQIRQLAKRQPPLRIVAPGRVYRRDDIDATHSLMFHQVEILALEKRGELNLGHLKGTVEHFLKNMLGPDIQIRFRGSYFPFTEPSMEVDVFFRGRWLEVLGCGMVDPNVLEKAGIDPTEYSGFAAGFGVERFAMVIHQIGDLREFFKNDKRLLKQFPHFYDDGMDSFLRGDPPEETIEYRGPNVPDPLVDSMDELKERNAQSSAVAATENVAVTAEPPKPDVVAGPSSEIDFSKLDVRVGVITKAWEHAESDKLFCEEIDIGEESGPRRVASGLRAYYQVDDLADRRVLIVANLKARKLAGFESHGMVLCASHNDQVQFVEPPLGALVGERVMLAPAGTALGEPATENQILKKKMLDVILPDLKTNAQGIVTYQGIPLMTSAGPCQPTLPNANVG